MLVQLFIVTCILEWFAESVPVPLDHYSGMCHKFMKTINNSYCIMNYEDEWSFYTNNIIVKITLNELLDIECLYPDEIMHEELNFFKFSSHKYDALVLNKCTELSGLNTDIRYLDVSDMKNFDLHLFSKLQTLSLTNVTHVDNLKSCAGLEKLEIHGMKLSNLALQLDRLTDLKLKLNNLTDDLSGLRLENLQNLRLLSNQNLQLVNFVAFPNLVHLEIDGKFTDPDAKYDINQMRLNTKLEILVMSDMKLLYDGIWNERIFGGHPNLKSISLANSRISNINSSRIFDLPNLVTLNLYGNELSDIEFLVGTELPRLRILNLGNNRINSLNKNLYTLTALEQLYLNSNRIKRIESGFFTAANSPKKCLTIYLQGNPDGVCNQLKMLSNRDDCFKIVMEPCSSKQDDDIGDLPELLE